MSSLFDIPAQLAMLLSLAATAAGPDPAPNPKPSAESTPAVVEPLVGPMRFGERGWLRALHETSAEVGGYASRVFLTSGGRYYVVTPKEAPRVLEARNDAAFAARVARAAAEHNAVRIRAAIQRQPTAGDLYIAHLFGADTAIALLRAASSAPGDALDAHFPQLAAALPEQDQRSITVGQFYRKLSGAVREAPRLVAIGLRPSVADAPREDRVSEPADASPLAWQPQVDVAAADRPRPAQ